MSWIKCGTLASMWGCSVKSTQVSRLDQGSLWYNGLANNRSWVVWDLRNDCVVTAKRKRSAKLLLLQSWTDAEDGAIIFIPGIGAVQCGDPRANQFLSEFLELRAELREVALLKRALPTNYGFDLKPGMGVDSSPVTVISTNSMRTIGIDNVTGAAHFRPTLVVDLNVGSVPFPEDAWVLRYVRISSPDDTRRKPVILAGRKLTERCPEPGWAQLGLPARPDLLQATHRLPPRTPLGSLKAGMYLGVSMTVVEPGKVHEGDEVSWYSPG